MKPVPIANSFSVNMIARSGHREPFDGDSWMNYHLLCAAEAVLQFIPVTPGVVAEMIRERGVDSYIGHPDTARIVSRILGVEIPFDAERRSFVFDDHSTPLFIAQYSGPRLPPGAETLPDGAAITFWMVLHDYRPD